MPKPGASKAIPANPHPAVSVVMSVYNGEAYLSEAIQSILAQTLADFEFIIINDGSTDDSAKILSSFAKKDKRIKVLEQKNKGLVASLNRGVKESKADLIARQDADDRSASDRLLKQVEFFKNNPGVVAVGSSIDVLDTRGKVLHRHTVLLNDPEIREELLVRSPFAHGSVMFRRSAALKVGLYKQEAWPAEDYDFWLRLSSQGQLANLDEALYFYREHGQSISSQQNSLQRQKTREVQQKAWHQRNSLLSKQKVKLSDYKSREMGQLRIQRILANELFIARKAAVRGHGVLAGKKLSSLMMRPVTYKKLAGKIKRGVKS